MYIGLSYCYYYTARSFQFEGIVHVFKSVMSFWICSKQIIYALSFWINFYKGCFHFGAHPAWHMPAWHTLCATQGVCCTHDPCACHCNTGFYCCASKVFNFLNNDEAHAVWCTQHCAQVHPLKAETHRCVLSCIALPRL